MSGALTPLSGFPVTFAAGHGQDGYGLTSRDGTLWVSDLGSDTLDAFTIDAASGALSPKPGYPLAGGGVEPRLVPGLPFLFVAGSHADRVNVFALDSQGGATQAPGSPVGSGDYPFGTAVFFP